MNSKPRSITLSRRDLLLCAGGISVVLLGTLADAALNTGTSNSAAVAAAAARLEALPETIGVWTSSAGSIDERERRVAEIAGAVRREYRNPQTGYVVTLTLLSGAAGPMSVHPPTACFEGVGYTLASGPTVVTLTATPDPAIASDTSADQAETSDRSASDRGDLTVSLNRATFLQPDSSLQETVRVFWGWSTDGRWDVPANPRLAFRGQPALYKLYVIDRSADSAHPIPQAESFLEEALPVLQRVLTSGSSESTTH